MAALKLRRLPDRTPVRITLAIPPELHRLLEEYAAVYREVYGAEETVADLLPFMLRTFLEGDRAFQRARHRHDRDRG
jgi:hypothetical protein